MVIFRVMDNVDFFASDAPNRALILFTHSINPPRNAPKRCDFDFVKIHRNLGENLSPVNYVYVAAQFWNFAGCVWRWI